jgi:hypothetical protein
MQPVGPPAPESPRVPWVRRAGWLLAYWLLGVAVVGAAAYGLRVVMGWAGLRL